MAKQWDNKSYAIAVLRRASYRIPARTIAFGKARIARGRYRCAHCKGEFNRQEVAVDHIEPVVPTTGWSGFDSFIERLFCPAEGLQVLCRDKCHAKKTKEENAVRRVNRGKSKKI